MRADNPLNLPPAAGTRDFFAEVMRFTLPPPESGDGPPTLGLRDSRGEEEPSTLRELRPALLTGTPDTLEDSPESVEVYHFSILADRFLAGGNARLALRQLLNAEVIDPGNPAVLERLARASEAAGDRARALACWDRLEVLFPDDGGVRAARIRALLGSDRRVEARAAAEAAAARPATRAHLLCRFYHDALRVLDGPDSADPPRPESYDLEELSILVRRMNDPLREADRLFGPGSRPRLLQWLLAGPGGEEAGWPPDGDGGRPAGEALWLLQVALRDGRAEAAEIQLQTLDGLGVRSPWLELARVQGRVLSGRRDEAVQGLEALRKAGAASEVLCARMGELWMACDQPARAVELLLDAARRQPPHHGRARTEFLLACALAQRGQNASAAQILRRLAREHPADTERWLRNGGPGVQALREAVRRLEAPAPLPRADGDPPR